ncbi:hypothetical protein B0H10DRAFT_2217227 [Mycena sp. CBHHK59/15]|nr:hypothetical protein B0H10DRAFT_2217227 [Mycena sp. CBHHK59/15]
MFGRDPIAVWVALRTPAITELVDFAITLLKIVVNQAGVEHVFSDVKVKQTQRQNRLKLLKLDKMTKVGADIKSDHLECGLVALRTARNVHKSTAKLLTIPRYRDLLDDQDDEDSTGGKTALVSTVAGWRTVMKRWIDDAQAAAEDTDSSDSDDDDTDISPGPAAKP